MYKSLGFNQFFDANHYNMENKEEVLSYGLMDKPFFKESIPMLETLKQPFYTKFITVSHHFPYAMDQEKQQSASIRQVMLPLIVTSKLHAMPMRRLKSFSII